MKAYDPRRDFDGGARLLFRKILRPFRELQRAHAEADSARAHEDDFCSRRAQSRDLGAHR